MARSTSTCNDLTNSRAPGRHQLTPGQQPSTRGDTQPNETIYERRHRRDDYNNLTPAKARNDPANASTQPHKSQHDCDCSIDAGEIAAKGHCWDLREIES